MKKTGDRNESILADSKRAANKESNGAVGLAKCCKLNNNLICSSVAQVLAVSCYKLNFQSEFVICFLGDLVVLFQFLFKS